MIDLITRIDLPLYAQVVLIYIFIHLMRKAPNRSSSIWLFIALIGALSFNNISEMFSGVFEGAEGQPAYYGHWLLKSVIFVVHSLPTVIWAAYIDFQFFSDWKRLKRRLKFYALPLVISLVMVLINPLNHFVFSIGSNNIYERGLGAYVIMSFSYLIVLTMYITSRKYKSLVDARVLESVFWFTLIPLIGGTLQLFYYGILLVWPSYVLAVLITFNLVEKENMMKDPLTGLKTRGQLEERVAYKIKQPVAFGIILMDMNHFKDINDNFGHIEGDEALQTVAAMMKANTQGQDMVCRYGGDEFVLLMESLKDNSLPSLIRQLDDGIKTYNRTSGKPYKLSMSFGGVFVEKNFNGNIQELLAKADERMYHDKAARKSRFLGAKYE